MKKPRGDSQLKTLPPDKQAQVMEWLNTGTQRASLKKIEAEYGFKTSPAALTEFFSWWHLSRHLEEAVSFGDNLKKTLRSLPDLNLDDEQINKAAQVAFELEAVKTKDFKTFYHLRKLRLKEVDQRHDHRRITLLEKKAAQADQAEQVIKSEQFTPEEKLQQMRAIFGMT